MLRQTIREPLTRSVAQRKLAKLMRDRGAAAVVRETRITEPTLRAHRDGRSSPRIGAREDYRRVGIGPAEWDMPDATSAPPTTSAAPTSSAPTAPPPRPREKGDELAQSLASAQAIFRVPGSNAQDRIRALRVALGAINGQVKTPRPRSIVEYLAFDDLAGALDQALENFAPERTTVAAVFSVFDAKLPIVPEGPCEALDEIVAFADELIAAPQTANRDRAAALMVKTRAGKLLKRVDDDPKTAQDWGDLKAALLAAVGANASALEAVATACGA